MNCWTARRRGTEYVDGRLRANERSRIQSHLRECLACSVQVEQMESIRSELSSLPQPVGPPELKTALYVTASRERQAILERRGSRLKRFWDHWRLRLDQIMRPLTIPATGGLLASFMLFGALTFTIENSSHIASYEVPVLYPDRADANLVPLQLRSAVMLTLSLDGSGRIRDYSVQDGSASYVVNPARLQSNNISLPAFPSVLALAQPINGDVSILFRPILFRRP